MLNKSELRREDIRMSNNVSEFLDNYVYTYINGFSGISRNDEDIDMQYKGVDIEFDYNGFHYICDEKAGVSATNKQLPTFCLELGFVNQKNSLNTGWFVNDECVNNSYMFVWTDKSKTDNILSYTDLTEVEVCLVKKAKIYEYLEKLGWTKKKLVEKCAIIRDTKGGCKMGDHKINGLKFSYSEKGLYTNKELVEKPINLILKREIYRKLSDFKTVVKC